MKRLALFAVTVLLAASASGAAGATAAPRDASSVLQIREILVPGAPIPIEGEISYVRVTRLGGGLVRRATLPFGGKPIRVQVRGGSYVVAVWHRTCDANCGMLDPPSDRCHATVKVATGATTRLTVRNRPGSPCRIVTVS